MEFFDSHAHYDDEKFDKDRYEIIDRIYHDGVTKFVSAGYDVKSSETALKLANKYDFIYTISGISPNDVKESIELCRQAHIKPIMITGDNKDTAYGIGKELDLVEEGDIILTSDELNKMEYEFVCGINFDLYIDRDFYYMYENLLLNTKI